MKTLSIVAVGLLWAFSGPASGQTWTQLGPFGYKNVRHIASTSDATTWYGADEGGIVKSINSGANWTQISPSGTRTIAVKGNDGLTAITGGAAVQLEYTTNGGTNWYLGTIDDAQTVYPTALAAYTTGTRQANMIAARKNTATTVQAIYYSTNSGVNWLHSTGTNYIMTVFDVAAYPTDNATWGDHAWAGSTNGVHHSGNLGHGWDAATLTTQNASAIGIRHRSGSNPIVYAGTSSGRVYFSVWPSSGSPTWQQMTSPSSDTVRSIAIDQNSSPNILIYAATDRAIYKLAHDGSSTSVTWTALTTTIDQPIYSVTISPSSSTTLFAGSSNFLYTTTDAGSTWLTVAGGTPLLVASAASNGSNQWGVSPSLSASENYNGTAWAFSNRIIGSAPNDIYSGNGIIQHPSTSKLYTGGAMNDIASICLSTNSGSGWTKQTQAFAASQTGTSFQNLIVDPSPSSTFVYAYGRFKYGTLYKNWMWNNTSGDDNHWSVPGAITDNSVISFVNIMVALGDGASGGSSSIFYAGLATHGCFRVDNFSAMTQVAPSGFSGKTVYGLALNPAVPSVLYAGAAMVSGLWKSTNANAGTASSVTFTQNTVQSGMDTVRSILIDPRYTGSSFGSNYVFVAARQKDAATDKVYRTTNGGTSWSDVSSGLASAIRINELRSDASSNFVMYAATDKSLCKVQFPVSPTGLTVNGGNPVYFCNHPQLCWSAASGASSYHVLVSSSPTFSTTFEEATGVASTCYTLTNSLSCGTTYYWRVSSTSIFGESDPTSGSSFTPTTVAPTLSSPASGTQNLSNCNDFPISLTWTAPATCPTGTYEIQVDDENTFTAPFVDDVTGRAFTNLSEGNVACGKTYYWRVRADGCPGSPWSQVWTYATIPCTPPAPSTAIAPLNGQTTVEYCDQVTFTWSSVLGGDAYYVQVASDAIFGTIVWQGGSTSASVTTSSFTQAKGTIYYWRVDAFNNCNSTSSAWSSTWSYTTSGENGGPAGPSLSSPSNGATGVCEKPVFTWSNGKWAVNSRLQVSALSDFSVITREVLVINGGATYTYANPALSLNTTYYWHVQAENCYGTSGYSGAYSFTTTTISCGSSTIPVRTTSEQVKPQDFSLAQNYPNPFNPTTRFDYALPNDAVVSLRVFNVLGQEVVKLVDEFQTAGYKSVEFDAAQLPSGLYFYRLQAGKFVDTKKMMLVR